MMKVTAITAAFIFASAGTSLAQTIVLPTLPHAATNVAPFGRFNTTHHQVYHASLFTPLLGGMDAIEISAIGFSATGTSYIGDTWQQHIRVTMGYTAKEPGVAPPLGLDLPSTGTNPSGSMTPFMDDPAFIFTPTSADPAVFEMVFTGTPFIYDPTQGHLLIEVFTDGARSTRGQSLGVSRSAGSGESSRSYEGESTIVSPTTALRTLFRYTPVSAGCYADCDTSTGVGVLDIFDFLCFGNRFSSNDPYACDCDTSTGVGVCDIFDFLCFGNEFNAGCP